MQLQDNSILGFLKKDFPDIAILVEEKFASSAKNAISDLSKISLVVDEFTLSLNIRKVTQINYRLSSNVYFCSLAGVERNYKVTEIREVLIGVLLKFFCEERLLGYVNCSRYRLIADISKKTGLTKQNLSNIIRNVVFFYKQYPEFKNRVDLSFDQIRLKFLKDD